MRKEEEPRDASADVDIDLVAIAREGLAGVDVPAGEPRPAQIDQQHIIDELRALVAGMESGQS